MKKKNDKLENVMSQMMGSQAVNFMSMTFRCMEIAGRELDEMMKIAAPHLKKKLKEPGAMKAMIPTPPLRGKSEELYLAHCRELIGRVLCDEDTKPATKAEMCAFLSDRSLNGPISRVEMETYSALFVGLFPKKAPDGIVFKTKPESRQKLLEQLKHQLTYQER